MIFFEPRQSAAAEIAKEAITLVRALYAVEGQGSNASVEDRLRLCQEQSASVLAELREKHFDWKEQLLPKHPMAEAIKNALGYWEELNVFVADGAVAIDNKCLRKGNEAHCSESKKRPIRGQ